MAVKGKTNNPNGRPKGAVNKATLEFKEAVNKLIDFATPQMVTWLETIAKTNPDKALDHVYKFAQFGYPLLSRTTIDGDKDKPLAMEWTLNVVNTPSNRND